MFVDWLLSQSRFINGEDSSPLIKKSTVGSCFRAAAEADAGWCRGGGWDRVVRFCPSVNRLKVGNGVGSPDGGPRRQSDRQELVRRQDHCRVHQRRRCSGWSTHSLFWVSLSDGCVNSVYLHLYLYLAGRDYPKNKHTVYMVKYYDSYRMCNLSGVISR